VGIIDEVGADVSEWKEGQRAGVGWHGGHDGTCLSCRRGDFGNCRNMKIAGISYDGGYQQYMVAPVEALVAIPESLNDTEAAPLLCAGVTTFNALRRSGSLPPDLVAVQGVGAIEVTPIQLISGSRTIQGWASGTPTDSEDTLRFAELTGVRPMIDVSTRKSGRGIRADAQRRSTIPRRSNDVRWPISKTASSALTRLRERGEPSVCA
jgi:D-arabinose 1-dehydrogenase-like Zn-dependent alcohol dehydrogenase